MTLQEKQAKLTVIGLQIESLTNAYNVLKTEVVKEMNSSVDNLITKDVEKEEA